MPQRSFNPLIDEEDDFLHPKYESDDSDLSLMNTLPTSSATATEKDIRGPATRRYDDLLAKSDSIYERKKPGLANKIASIAYGFGAGWNNGTPGVRQIDPRETVGDILYPGQRRREGIYEKQVGAAGRGAQAEQTGELRKTQAQAAKTQAENFKSQQAGREATEADAFIKAGGRFLKIGEPIPDGYVVTKSAPSDTPGTQRVTVTPEHTQHLKDQADQVTVDPEFAKKSLPWLRPQPSGEFVIDKATANKLMDVMKDAGKPLVVAPGGAVFDPETKAAIFTNPAKPTEEHPSDTERYIQTWLKEHNQPDNATNRNQALAERDRATASPQKPPQALVMVPNGKGGFTAQQVGPGTEVGAGAMTAANMGNLNVPTAATRGMAEKAPRVINFVDRIEQLIKTNEAMLGPLQGRWNEYITGRIGVKGAEYTKLRTDVGLLTTALMNMHVGARGGEQIMEHFHTLINQAGQDPENLKAALGEIKIYAQEVAKEGTPKNSGIEGGGQPRPAVGGTIHFTQGTDSWDIPADRADAFLRSHPQALRR